MSLFSCSRSVGACRLLCLFTMDSASRLRPHISFLSGPEYLQYSECQTRFLFKHFWNSYRQCEIDIKAERRTTDRHGRQMAVLVSLDRLRYCDMPMGSRAVPN